MRRLVLKEKELDNEKAMKDKQLTLEFEIRKRELDVKHSTISSSPSGGDFDLSKCIRLVPQFNEGDVDSYFVMFERVAKTPNWPRAVWPLLLQSVLTGKAQLAYVSMSPDHCLDYDKVKAAVLRAYELVPEAYRQKFRKLGKLENQTYCEFGREKETLFDRWCQSEKVKDLNKLRNLVLLEEFKNCLPEQISTYVTEQKVTTVSDAAVLADEYVLTHRDSFDRFSLSSERSAPAARSSTFVGKQNFQGDKDDNKERTDTRDTPVCFYCKKRGHVISQCFALNRKSKPIKAVNLMRTESLLSEQLLPTTSGAKTEVHLYAPFVMKGSVSLTDGGPKVPINILRDSAASQSVLLQEVLPLSEKSSTNSSALVRGFGMQFVPLPLHTIHLESDLVKGQALPPGFLLMGCLSFWVTTWLGVRFF